MSPIIAVGGPLGLISMLTLPAYFRDIKVARQRQKDFLSRIVNTAKGLTEYATASEGDPVLVVHGVVGGYDQGILTGQTFVGQDYRIIAPSRFGYQNTPMPGDASPAAQADAFAALLNLLAIPKISVIGISAGAPSCLQFALRHSDRISKLVLVVPGVYCPESANDVQSVSFPFVISTVFKANYPLWLGMKLMPNSVLSTMGVPAPIQQQLTTEKKREIMNWLLPYETRIAGTINDGIIASHRQPAPIHNITAPTLVISARDDLWKTYGPARYTASHIQNAEFIGFDTGGHLLNGREEKVRSEIRSFLAQHAGKKGL